MKAKFIYEKFAEDSDPIIDMGIGLKRILEEDIKKYGKMSWRLLGSVFFNKEELSEEGFLLWSIIKEIYEKNEYSKIGFQHAFESVIKRRDFIQHYEYFGNLNIEIIVKELYNRYGIEVNFNKSSVNEKFTENNSDPIKDLGIGKFRPIDYYRNFENIENSRDEWFKFVKQLEGKIISGKFLRYTTFEQFWKNWEGRIKIDYIWVDEDFEEADNIFVDNSDGVKYILEPYNYYLIK